MNKFDLRVILVVMMVLTIITGFVTEILKKVFWQNIPTSLLAVVVAEGLTLGAGFIYAKFTNSTVLLYHMVAAVAAGLHVAGASMVGFDKFVEIKREIRRNKRAKRNRGAFT